MRKGAQQIATCDQQLLRTKPTDVERSLARSSNLGSAHVLTRPEQQGKERASSLVPLISSLVGRSGGREVRRACPRKALRVALDANTYSTRGEPCSSARRRMCTWSSPPTRECGLLTSLRLMRWHVPVHLGVEHACRAVDIGWATAHGGRPASVPTCHGLLVAHAGVAQIAECDINVRRRGDASAILENTHHAHLGARLSGFAVPASFPPPLGEMEGRENGIRLMWICEIDEPSAQIQCARAVRREFVFYLLRRWTVVSHIGDLCRASLLRECRAGIVPAFALLLPVAMMVVVAVRSTKWGPRCPGRTARTRNLPARPPTLCSRASGAIA